MNEVQFVWPECDHPLRVSVASHTNHILKMVVDKTLLLFVIVFTQVMTSMSCRIPREYSSC